MSELLAFKVAFISRCAEEGLTLNQVNDRVKTAVASAEARYGNVKTAGIPKIPKIPNLNWGGVLRTLGILGGVGAGGAVWQTGTKIVDKASPFMEGAAATLPLSDDPKALLEGGLLGHNRDYIWPSLVGTAAVLAGGGLFAGKALAGAQENPDPSEEIKHKELLNEYGRLTDKTRKATRQRRLLENRG